ncbi:hypothetical protein [Lactimicrobium massiliense]|uniref:hypothetical protein n=1 Tax=Lactimicrobium massiliense TaxID=2161814 RepID=UPI0014356260|nr:hypothetical protein [Lactimicrobium massiliense]
MFWNFIDAAMKALICGCIGGCCLMVVGYGWYILIRSVWRLIKKLIKYIRSGNFMK